MFDYVSLFKSFNVFSYTVSGSSPSTRVVIKEEEEVEEEENVVIGSYKPPLVTPESPKVDDDAPNTPLLHQVKRPLPMLKSLHFPLKKVKLCQGIPLLP